MSLISQKINTNELYELLQYFFENVYCLDNNFKKQCNSMIEKLLYQTKKKIINNHAITFGLKKQLDALNKIKKQNILGIQNIKVAYIYYKCLQDIISENTTVTILKTTYSKELFEYEEFFDAITCLFMYSSSPTSKSISVDKIDGIVSNKKIAKNVRNNNVTTILTGRKDDKYFRPHKDTKTDIVPIESLGQYLDIGDKHTYIECPICGYDIKIDAYTIKNKIVYNKKRKNVQILCNHENTSYIKEMPYTFEYTHEDVKSIPMFFLNNYTLLVNKFLIAPKLRRINKKKKLINTHQLRDYLDIGSKYIFLEHPKKGLIKDDEKEAKENAKIKITKDNILKVISISDDKEKIYIKDSNTDYKTIAYIYVKDIENIVDTLSNNMDVAMTIINNYNLLLLKNLIHNMD